MSHGVGGDPTLLFAVTAGLASFLSPCVLPVIPAFLAHLGGTSLGEDVSRKRLFLSSLLFVLGFSLVFAVLGVLLNSFLRDASSEILVWLSRLAGAVIIVFGLHLAGLLEFRFLEQEYGSGVVDRLEPGYFTSFVFGAAFAVAWTPCVGPILGSVLSLAVTKPLGAFPLLVAYSAGLGTPFLLVGLFPVRFDRLKQRYGGRLAGLQRLFGYVLIALGVLVFTMRLSAIANVELLTELVS